METRPMLAPQVVRTLSAAACAAAALSGVVLIARAAAGLFELGVSVRSPLNAQSIFGVSVTLLALLRSHQKRLEEMAGGAIRSGWAKFGWAAVVGGTALAFLPALGVAPVSDDYVLLVLARSASTEYLFEVWTTPGGDGFYRPFGLTWMMVAGALSGGSPLIWRLLSLLVHLINTVLVWRMGRMLGLGEGAALVAAALFGIHGSRPEAVVWIAAVFDRLAAACVLGALLLFAHAYQRRNAAFTAAAAGLMLLGIWSKETAYCLPLMAALVARVVRGPRWTRRAWLALAAAAMAAFVHRWWLLGGIGGYVDSATGEPQALLVGPLTAAKVLLWRLWSALYFPINWSTEPGAPLTVLLALAALTCLMLAWRGALRKPAWMALGFTLAAALPALPQLLLGADLEKARLLYLPSAGFCLFLACCLSGVEPAQLRAGAAVALLSFQVAALSHNLSLWKQTAAVAHSVCETVARAATGPGISQVTVRGLPGSIDGVYFFRNGLPECVTWLADNPIGLAEIVTLPENATAVASPQAVVLDWQSASRRLQQSGGASLLTPRSPPE